MSESKSNSQPRPVEQNFVFSICQAYYGYWNGFSSTSIYASLYISVFNLLLNSVPPFFIALFEQHKLIDTLESNPLIYRTIRKNKSLTAFEFIKWNAIAIWHSLVCFFVPLLLFQQNCILLENGKNLGSYQFGSLVLILVFIIVHLRIFLIWRYQNIFALVSYLASLLGFVFTCFVMSSFIVPFPLTEFTENQALYFGIFVLFSSGSVWFTIILSSMIAILPDLIVILIENLAETRGLDKIIEKQKEKLLRLRRPASPSTTVENLSLYSMDKSSNDFGNDRDNSSSYSFSRNNNLSVGRNLNASKNRISPVNMTTQTFF